MSFQIEDVKKALNFKDALRQLAFKEQVEGDRQFSNYFARVHFDFVSRHVQQANSDKPIFRANDH
jgi:hypothetical protein